LEIIEECPIQKLEIAAAVIQDFRRELHKCMVENIEKLTGKEIEAVIFVIHLIYSGDSEIVSGNTAAVGIFREALGKLLRVNFYRNY